MKTSHLCIAGIVLLLSCCGKETRVEKVFEDGVEVVLNHLEPYQVKGEPSHLGLREETRIDFEKDETSALGLKEPGIIEADSKGNIFVIDKSPGSESLIYKFSPAGRFISKFGKRGQGPGEIQGIWGLMIDENDHLRVTDHHVDRGLEFDTEGRMIKEARLPPGLLDVIPLPNGNFLGRRYSMKNTDPIGMSLCLVDPEFREIKRLDFYDRSAPGKKSSGIIGHFYWRVAGSRIYVGNGGRGYEIRVWDLDGNLIRKIRKEFKTVAYPEEFRLQTEKKIAAGIKDLFVLNDMPPVNSFFIDETGRLFVMTYEQGRNRDELIHDVFNADGVFVARVPLGRYGILNRALNPLRATAKNGRFYRLRYKENGSPELIVYRMMWE